MASHKGMFKAKNPKKYKGDPTKIIYRSMWEFHFMMELDHDENVVWWQSEEFHIPYADPTRETNYGWYFVDFCVRYRDGRTVLYEIKPYSQTVPPPPSRKNTKAHVKACLLYAKNRAKWEAAERYCAKRGYEFRILTENELYGGRRV